jgi:anti-sigma regulatory factor (Ser/Thr protein kinase)
MQMFYEGEPSSPAREFEFSLADLGRIRHTVRSAAVASGFSRSRADDLALAVDEVACNAIVHGRPPARLKVWEGDGELICEVSDAGDGIEDVRAGQLTPAPEGPAGRGLWLSRLICDAVEIRNGDGCTVSLRAAAPS